MVFGLFSRKRNSSQVIDVVSRPDSPELPNPDGPSAQLRTPSPSVNSASVDKQDSPSREPPLTPSPPPEPLADQNATNLSALIQSIPPQTLHTYTLAQLLPPNAQSSEMITHLSSFFSQLVPPPRLHCVRCHKGFFEVENTDRSCLVPHDDDSAEVERVNSKGKGTLYETLWGCCGRTVEGDGDQGPPDGWCYEGKHTTDAKRARFRADSTPQDDKLTSCGRLRCNGLPRSTRKRARPDDKTDAEDDEEADSSVALSASPRSSVGAKRRRPAKKSRTQLVPVDSNEGQVPSVKNPADAMDVDEAPLPAETEPSTAKAKAPSSRNAKAQSLRVPRTSSPLALAPSFVSRSVSPGPESTVIIEKKPKSAVAGALKPKSSFASMRKKTTETAKTTEQGSPKVQKSVDTVPSHPSPSKASPKPKVKRKARTKGLVEVVESSVAAERTSAK